MKFVLKDFLTSENHLSPAKETHLTLNVSLSLKRIFLLNTNRNVTFHCGQV